MEPGSVIHIHYIRSFKTFPLPHVCEEIPLGAEIPVISLVVELRYPKKTSLSAKVFNVADATPETKSIDYGSVSSLDFHDLLPLKNEELSPPEVSRGSPSPPFQIGPTLSAGMLGPFGT